MALRSLGRGRTPIVDRFIDEVSEIIARRLRIARIKAGYSQEEAAAIAGCTRQNISLYERGRGRITASALWALAELYDRPITFFYPAEAGDDDAEPDHRRLTIRVRRKWRDEIDPNNASKFKEVPSK